MLPSRKLRVPSLNIVFETVAPRRAGSVSRHLRSLPVSIALHALIIGAALAQFLATVEFPRESPRSIAAYYLTAEPPPPPPPPPPPAAARGATTPTRVTQPTEIVAPTVIPETIPVVTPEPEPAGVVEGISDGIADGVVGGDPNGVAGGVIGGQIGGVIGGILTEKPLPPPDTVIIERDEPLPMTAMSQVYPVYPEDARLKGWEDTMLIRYTIAKDGRVRLVEVLRPPKQKVFEHATLRAVRTWRFRPLLVDGKPKEVIHELTVNFELDWLRARRAAAAAAAKR